MVTVIISYNC